MKQFLRDRPWIFIVLFFLFFLAALTTVVVIAERNAPEPIPFKEPQYRSAKP